MPNLIANAVYEDEDILDFDDEDSKYDLDQIEDEMDSIGMMEQQGSSNDSMDGSNDSMGGIDQVILWKDLMILWIDQVILWKDLMILWKDQMILWKDQIIKNLIKKNILVM